jgi:hypothetical protein
MTLNGANRIAMNDESNQPPLMRDSTGSLDLARSMRFALACIVVGLSYFPIRASLNIPSVMSLMSDMLGARSQLPAITQFVFNFQLLFVAISFALPALCVGLLFIRNIPLAIKLIGVVALLTIILAIILHQATWAPVTEILRRMQGGGPM